MQSHQPGFGGESNRGEGGGSPSPDHSAWVSEVSILDVLKDRGHNPGTTPPGQTQILFRCPLPGHDDMLSMFSANTLDNSFKCLGCGQHGNVIDLVMLMDGVDHTAAVAILESKYGDPADHISRAPVSKPAETPTDGSPGFSLEQLATMSGLPMATLEEFGVGTIHISSRKVVRFPYRNAAGQAKAVRFRTSPAANSYSWKSDSKPILYGPWRLDEMRDRGYVIIVDNELDAIALWSAGFPALGVPSPAWKDEWASDLESFEAVYVVASAGKAGETLRDRLMGCSVRPRLRMVSLGDLAEDITHLYRQDHAGFIGRVEALLAAAEVVAEMEEKTAEEEAALAESLSRELAAEPDILAHFGETIAGMGLAGEQDEVMLLYLAFTSRLFPKPVPVVMKGESSTGKSYLPLMVRRFFPESATYLLTSASERFLIYTSESFVHRIIIIYEIQGLKGGFLAYIIRSLISEGHIKYPTLVPSEDGWQEKTFIKEGPTGLIIGTTKLKVDKELETRVLSLKTDDSPEQTRSVFQKIAEQEGCDPQDYEEMLRPWVALQTWLSTGPHKVMIPYIKFLAEATDARSPRLRRDFTNVLTLIRAHALLHRQNRELDEKGRIVATYHDYERVYRLTSRILSEGVEAAAPEEVQKLVEAVNAMVKKPQEGVTIRDLATRLKVDAGVVRRHAIEALTLGVLKNIATGDSKVLLVPGDPMTEDSWGVLPPPYAVLSWLESGDDDEE